MSTKSNSEKRNSGQPQKKTDQKWIIEKVIIPIAVALLGLFGVIFAAILGSRYLAGQNTIVPTPTLIPQPQIIPFANKTGDKIFFLRGNDYYMMSLDGTYQTLIAKYPQALVVCPAISPDGEKLLFNSNVEGFADLYTIDRDGKNIKNITNNEGFDEVCASWSPDQRRILFYNQYSDDNNDIFMIDIDGKNETRLTDTYANSVGVKNMVSESAWSPDESKIVFNSNRDGDLEIYIYEFSTKNIVQVTDNTVDDYRASWSPDGTKIIYTSRINGDNTEIFIIDLTISVLPTIGVNITNNPAHDTDATWSPDSTKIAFTSNRAGNEEIYIMDINGSNVLKLTNTPEAENKPRWIR